MSLFCVVAGLLGHATVLEPMGVSDILGGVPSVHANDAARSSGASEASKAAKPSAGTCLPICHAEKHKAWSVKCAWAERCKGCEDCTGPPSDAAGAAAKTTGAAAAAAKAGARTQGDEVFVGGPRDLGSGDTSSELGSGDTSSDLGSGDTSTSAPTGSSAADRKSVV